MAKTALDFDPGQFFKNINREFAKGVRSKVVPEIVKTIKSGSSPVAKYGRYERYSDRYKKDIQRGKYSLFGKRTRPVNLTLSGKMLRAFKVREISRGGVAIFNTNKLAKFHNDLGAGKSKVIRKMLPGNNERFKRSIQRVIDRELEKAASRILRK